ncbi:acyl-CoA thioesterase [Paenibacillus selenitireducens]|uniref:acyl-CoA thioesterase n=1 Tax=Paenibacillus selenitireducens TaxID=1324314 RepID=UPI00117F28BD|nr:thioesterase family protein [Paenibacillus selenitireducens]
MRYSRWFYTHIRVRYQETDQMGVVYHANYLNWFEIGRTELIRELGIDYREIEQHGLLLPVTEINTQFHTPARYDDRVTICTRIADFSALKLHFESQVRLLTEEERLALHTTNDKIEPTGKLLVSGATHHVWVNRDFRPVRMARETPELFALLEKATERTDSDVT